MVKIILVATLAVAAVELALTPFSDMIGGEHGIRLAGFFVAGLTVSIMMSRKSNQEK